LPNGRTEHRADRTSNGEPDGTPDGCAEPTHVEKPLYFPFRYCSSLKEYTHCGLNATRTARIHPFRNASGMNINGKKGSTVSLRSAKL
jgi:hypothetical protein